MTNKEKLIKLYNESLETGKLPFKGLCVCLLKLDINRNNLYLFKPQSNDYFGDDILIKIFWGYEFNLKENKSLNEITCDFTPLRQTILAFLIAMED